MYKKIKKIKKKNYFYCFHNKMNRITPPPPIKKYNFNPTPKLRLLLHMSFGFLSYVKITTITVSLISPRRMTTPISAIVTYVIGKIICKINFMFWGATVFDNHGLET